MMPLTFANLDEDNIVRMVGGKPETRQHLENLGFVAGPRARIVSEIGGNLVVRVKDARVAINREMAGKIFI